jgi:hypothetical protein
MAAINIGIGRKFKKYSPFVKVGYEFSQFHHAYSLGWVPYDDVVYEDKVFYDTFYHLLKLGIGIKM